MKPVICETCGASNHDARVLQCVESYRDWLRKDNERLRNALRAILGLANRDSHQDAEPDDLIQDIFSIAEEGLHGGQDTPKSSG